MKRVKAGCHVSNSHHLITVVSSVGCMTAVLYLYVYFGAKNIYDYFNVRSPQKACWCHQIDLVLGKGGMKVSVQIKCPDSGIQVGSVLPKGFGLVVLGLTAL